MKIRFSYIFIGVGIILSGIRTYITKWDNLYGIPLPRSTSIMICLLGVIIIVNAFIQKKKGSDRTVENMLICAGCQEVYKREDVVVMVCPKCDGKIVTIDDYLKINPDMKAEILQYIENTERSNVVD